jgi:hypothetical protein
MHTLFFSFLKIVLLGRDTLWHVKKFLQYIKYIIFEFTPSIILLYPSAPIPGVVSTDIFPLHTYVHRISTIFTLPHPISTFSPLSPVPNSPLPQTGPVLLSCSRFCKREIK